MSGHGTRTNERAEELRQAFDRSFARAADAAGDEASIVEDLLAVRIGSHPYALRLAEVSGLFVDKKMTRLPSAVTELLGLAGFRGAVLPVFDLGMLLGSPRATAPRWLVVTADARIGLAFEAFEGYVSARRDAIVPDARAEVVERHLRETLQTHVARPIIHLHSVLETVRNRAGLDRQA